MRVEKTITDEMVEGFAKGVTIGVFNPLPASLKKISSEEQGDWGEVILKEGMYHQIKRRSCLRLKGTGTQTSSDGNFRLTQISKKENAES